MNRRHKNDSPVRALLYLLGAFFLLSIFWVNFHGAMWYQMDVYTYAYEGRLMHEARSFFPEGWVFGNQYHIISSPNVSSLFYGLVKDSATSMAIASSLTTVLILLSFYWCFHGFIGKTGMAAGLLCIGGGIVFGTNAAKYVSGLQVLYTMASFYASYLLVLLLTLGCWLRLRNHSKPPYWILPLVLILNFAAGMQSPRELLVLSIPILALEGIQVLYRLAKGDSFKDLFLKNGALLFVIGVLVFELAGHFYMKSLHILKTPIIGDLQPDFSIGGLAAHFWASAKNLLRISGITIVADGIEYLPLSICALLVAASVIWCLFHIARTRDDSPLALAVVFCVISLLGVFFVGVFLMRTRDIYYFVYWLLASLSVIYLFQHTEKRRTTFWEIALLVVCSINYGFSFLPVFKDYRLNNLRIVQFSEHLADQGVQVIYVGSASPILAATSHDRIISQAIWLDATMASGYPLSVFPSDKYLPAFDDQHQKDALICFSNDYLNFVQIASDPFKKALESNLVPFDELHIGSKAYVLYRFIDRIIAPVSITYVEMD